MSPSIDTHALRESTRKPPESWQREAAAAWLLSRHPTRGPGHGIVEAATGLGKTILAMTCMVEASRLRPDLRFVIVVPNRELARQWILDLRTWFELDETAVGKLGDGGKGNLDRQRFLVAVINSARTHLPAMCAGRPVMLVVDECHASASPENRALYEADTVFRLGISATAQVAGQTDAFGVVLPLERQPHALELGPLCYRMDFKRADALGLMPPFRIVHHGIVLNDKAPPGATSEAERYAELTHALTQAILEAEAEGVFTGQVAAIMRHPDRWPPNKVKVATALHAAMRARKQFLFLLPVRNRIAATLVEDAFAQAQGAGQDLQVLLFNERVRLSEREFKREQERAGRFTAEAPELDSEDDAEEGGEDVSSPPPLPFDFQGAERLHEMLRESHGAGRLAVEGATEDVVRGTYSGAEDEGAVAAMGLPPGAPGRARVLVTAKAANQGINLPNVDVGIIVASSSSILQRIQTLGRILRVRRVDGKPIPREDYARHFPKTLHVLYVKGTADEEIYLKTDWDQLLGRERNEWCAWEPGATTPVADSTPPVPPMTETEALAWVHAQLAAGATWPILWPSRLPPHQPVAFKHNHVRVATPGGKVGRDSPVVHNDAEIQRIVDTVARARRMDPVAMRGKMVVTLSHRLLLRTATDGLLPHAALDPRTGRPLKWPLVVLGQLQELPRVTNATPTEARSPGETPERHESRPSPRQTKVPVNGWVDGVRTFLAGGGVPVACEDDAPPVVAMLLRAGATDARLPPVERLPAARPEHLFAAWARAVALGDTARADTLAAELKRRVATEAKAYWRAVQVLAPR
jgi:hypothetical protein